MDTWRKGPLLWLLALAACNASLEQQRRTDQLVELETAEAQLHNDGAVALADRLLEESANDDERCPVYLSRSRALAHAGNVAGALADLDRLRVACGRDPETSAQGLLDLAWLAGAGGRHAARALSILRDVVRAFPDAAAAKRATLLIEEAVLQAGSRKDAIEALRRMYVVAGRSEVGPTLLFRAATLMAAEGDDWGALVLLGRLVRRFPASGLVDDALMERARLARKVGRAWDAVRLYQEVLERRESSLFFGSYETRVYADARFALGDAWLAASGDPDGAVARFGEFIDEYPRGARAAQAMFRCWEILDPAGRRGEARRWLERLVEEHPESEAAGRARAILGPVEGHP